MNETENLKRIKESIKRTTDIVYKMYEALQLQWIQYVYQQGGLVELPTCPELTMWDGASERFKQLEYIEGDVYLVDRYDTKFSLLADACMQTLLELCDVLFHPSPEE